MGRKSWRKWSRAMADASASSRVRTVCSSRSSKRRAKPRHRRLAHRLPSPCEQGEGQGGGRAPASRRRVSAPHPNLPPHGGEGGGPSVTAVSQSCVDQFSAAVLRTAHWLY